MKGKSPGVVIVSLLHLVVAIIILFLLPQFSVSSTSHPETQAYKGAFIFTQIIMVIAIIGLIMAGLGIFKLKNWARISSMIFFPFIFGLTVAIVFGILLKFSGLYLRNLIILLSYIGYIYYFTRPKVKEQFK